MVIYSLILWDSIFLHQGYLEWTMRLKIPIVSIYIPFFNNDEDSYLNSVLIQNHRIEDQAMDQAMSIVVMVTKINQ